MPEALSGSYGYVGVVLLLTVGLYGVVAKRNLLKKLIGLNIFQTATFLFFIHGAAKWGASVPVVDPKIGADPGQYVNPLPHVIVLTAIVVGVALTGVALALLLVVQRAHGTLEEEELRERMR